MYEAPQPAVECSQCGKMFADDDARAGSGPGIVEAHAQMEPPRAVGTIGRK